MCMKEVVFWHGACFYFNQGKLKEVVSGQRAKVQWCGEKEKVVIADDRIND
jgi:hypothetical protein